MCGTEDYYSKETVKKFTEDMMFLMWIRVNWAYLLYNKYKPFVYNIYFENWYFCLSFWKNTKPSKIVIKKSDLLKKKKIQKIQPS